MNALTAAEYESRILQEKEGILLDFWREDCAVCQSLSQELAMVAQERPELKIYSVDSQNEPELVQRFRVMMAPTLLFVQGGEVKKRSIGFKSKDSILQMAEQYFSPAQP